MKKTVFLFAILMATAFASQAQIRIGMDVILGRRNPNPNEARAMRAEEMAHPNITRAMHDIQNALDALNQAPDAFGGHKGQAEADLKQAYISLRKALYYRLYVDSGR